MLAVLYLVFNEGYSASAGGAAIRDELCDEAIRLAKLLAVLMPDEPEALGLLALMLLHDARREARVGQDGEIVLIADQDRSRWNQPRIERERACSSGRSGTGARAAISSRQRLPRSTWRTRPTGRRSPRSTTNWRDSSRRRSWS